ncbi:MAG: MBL fold metallo-hydrolase [Chloroflexota bacterium]|nr:MBL fold metallo-hydrolase [Chloroflexota bacterium]
MHCRGISREPRSAASLPAIVEAEAERAQRPAHVRGSGRAAIYLHPVNSTAAVLLYTRLGATARVGMRMEITFLGTAASEGYPNPFCACGNCDRARSIGGASLRKRSAAVIDDELLIDLGPDLLAAAQLHGRSLAGIRYALQTHEHADHLDPSLLTARSPLCQAETGWLDYYATTGALDLAATAIGNLPAAGLHDPAVAARLRLRPITVAPCQTFAVGPYLVSGVPANHDPRLAAMLFAIRRGDRALFYGTDSGPLPEAAWEYLKREGWRFSVVVLDHTFGLGDRGTGHMNAEQVIEQMARFEVAGLLAGDARFYAHHIAHHSNPGHDELRIFAAARGYDVAYDGLTVVV